MVDAEDFKVAADLGRVISELSSARKQSKPLLINFM
jgi:hypothetical protein